MTTEKEVLCYHVNLHDAHGAVCTVVQFCGEANDTKPQLGFRF
uniref:Uncharacterized protein n=1 Tax=Anguilla anguilla TaxID=7936 RepID=A0A0E9T337_ANGAN